MQNISRYGKVSYILWPRRLNWRLVWGSFANNGHLLAAVWYFIAFYVGNLSSINKLNTRDWSKWRQANSRMFVYIYVRSLKNHTQKQQFLLSLSKVNTACVDQISDSEFNLLNYRPFIFIENLSKVAECLEVSVLSLDFNIIAIWFCWKF